MKIIYCRKQAQACVEWVNVNNPALTAPLSLREVCERVSEGLLEEDKRFYKGITYNYVPFNGSKENQVLCLITVHPFYVKSEEDVAMYEVEIPDEEIAAAVGQLLEEQMEILHDGLEDIEQTLEGSQLELDLDSPMLTPTGSDKIH